MHIERGIYTHLYNINSLYPLRMGRFNRGRGKYRRFKTLKPKAPIASKKLRPKAPQAVTDLTLSMYTILAWLVYIVYIFGVFGVGNHGFIQK